MRAVVASEPNVVKVVDIPAPTIEADTDVIVKVTASAICGADLLPLSGHVPGFEWGTVMGHEFVGTVIDAGERGGFAQGTRVVCSSTVSCGLCWYCIHEMSSQCTQMALFGFSGVYPRLDGGQADFVRVPHGNRVLWALPEKLSDDMAVFVGDILPTAVRAVERGDVKPGDVVAVIGGGPVGLLAALVAKSYGATVFLVDVDQNRRAQAVALGIPTCGPEDAEAWGHERSEGRGPDTAIEASGNPAALTMALSLVRGRGTVSVSGAHFDSDRPIDVGTMFAKETSLRFAMGSPTDDRERVAAMILDGRVDPTPLITHTVGLDEAPSAYDAFRSHKATKVIFHP
jgi:2-desacetyl-2-hydroxyethyl bacteriochlorophyllide A dehydrogenase